jgi:methyl-accepting chemotaxis protein
MEMWEELRAMVVYREATRAQFEEQDRRINQQGVRILELQTQFVEQMAVNEQLQQQIDELARAAVSTLDLTKQLARSISTAQ